MRGRFRTTKRFLVYGAVRVLQVLATILPRPLALRTFAAIGNVVWHVDRPAVRRSRANLERAFGRRLSRSDRERVIRSMFQTTGRNLVDLLRLSPFDASQLESLVEFEGLEHLDRPIREGRGVVALSAHLGNWEVLGAALSARGYPLHVVAAKLFDRRSDRLLNAWRGAHGVHVHHRTGGLAPLLGVLRAGGIVGTLADQDVPGRARWVDFFGSPARTPVAPFVLARRTGAALVPIWIRLGSDGRHHVRVLPEILPSSSLSDLLSQWHAVLETAIRAHPEQWVWYHRRWKSPPPKLDDLRKFSRKPAYLPSFQSSRRRVFAR
jgi:KDO2-lipid IV(A) lauroyltransferase